MKLGDIVEFFEYWLVKLIMFIKGKPKRILGKGKPKFKVIEDIEDVRDFWFRYKVEVKAENQYYPDLSKYVKEVKQQGSIGSCGAHAGASFFEVMANKFFPANYYEGSELWLYWWARYLQGWQNKDSGVYLRDIMKVLYKQGLAPEKLWEYDVTKFKLKPPQLADDFARIIHKSQVRLKYYYKLNDSKDIQDALSLGLPVVFAVKVYSGLYKPDKDGFIGNSGSYLGGHAMLGVYWDKNKNAMKVLNSYDDDYGVGGYCYITRDYLDKYLISAWTGVFEKPKGGTNENPPRHPEG